MRVGVDTGGTFTDVVGEDGRIAKVLSTPRDPSEAVAAGVERFAPDVLAHGTTVATNALLERRGAVVALVTNEGFADLIEIARQDRPALYDATARRPAPLVSRGLRLEVAGRLGPDGAEREALGEVPAIPGGVEAVAVCLLHSDLDDRHEREVAEVLRQRGVDVTCSADVSPQHREYERLSTTVANAYLRPLCAEYLGRLSGLAGSVLVLTSAGGLVPVDEAARVPARLLLSGPAGGAVAAGWDAAAAGYPDAVTFDMGGTSTDVCLVLDGRPAPAGERTVAGLPVRLPSLDVHTIGAGGGSIARIDPGGALAVGPRSAGAAPGPACYGLGGTDPTVTDADLVAGRIPAGATLPGLDALDLAAATAALDDARVTADGVLAVVDAAMTLAVRRVSVERGVDPSGLALVAFGGAGPLHACAIADALGMPAVVVPPRAGVLSAAGVLAAPRQADVVRSWPTPSDTKGLVWAGLEVAREAMRRVDVEQGGWSANLRALESEPLRLSTDVVEVEVGVDCRYAGQSWELTVPTVAAFGDEHERRNGYRRDGTAIEVVAVRATARVPSGVDLDSLPPVARTGPVAGPKVIAEEDCTIWVADGWTADVHDSGSWVLRRNAPPGEASEPARPDRGSATPEASAASPTPATPYSPSTLAVLIARLTGVAEEMQAVLRRAASSPNIKERADCSCALFTAGGELLTQSESIPVHLGSMPASVAAAIAAFPGDELRPGDQVVLNDPFAGGTHLNDVTLVAPCHLTGEDGTPRLVGWVANRAHHADVGGMVPGSIPPDASEIYQEGLRLPPLRLGPEVVAVLLANSRTPEERRGDLDAQGGANAVGVARFLEVAAEGWELEEVVAYGERRMRAALTELPDGTVRFQDVLDSTGTDIHVAVEVAGDQVTFDFTGSGPQAVGNLNAVRAVTASAVAFALRCATDPDIPANGGALRPVRIVTEAGSVVDARAPAAVGAGNVEVSQRVADACLGALAQMARERVPAAGQGTMNNVILGSAEAGFVSYETLAGGQGGGPAHPGDSGVHTAMTNTRNTPVEAFERAYPMRVRRLSIRRGSGGAGRLPGGDGIGKEVEVLADCTLSLVTERRASQPWGLWGGEPGMVGENWLLRGGDEAAADRLPAACTVALHPGDVVRILTPGGGGWGSAPSS
jgi:5-oxoprolinase (ATP-hydrolysing)